MTFKTKLWVMFVTIITLPVILTAVTFWVLSFRLIQREGMNYGIEVENYSMWSDSLTSFEELTDDVFYRLQIQVGIDSARFLDKQYLKQVNDGLEGTSSYIIVRKGKGIYFSGNEEATNKIMHRLPEYGSIHEGINAGYYYSDMEKLVKQIDFVFPDQDEGSIFIVTKVNSVISKDLLSYLSIFIVSILTLTALLLTQWIRKQLFLPLRELNIAMHHIAGGNFDYVLLAANNAKDEMSQLYNSYEDMRLKLKESTEEMMEKEKQNKELVSNISHDLKTPITSIKGYVEGIIDGVADTPEKRDRYIKTIYTKACDMDRLISELTFYSGIDSNRIPYHFHRINVTDYFNDCVEDVGLELESENIQLNYTNLLNPDTMIIADPEQMKKVINNIIGNSIKYMDKEKGIIDIRLIEDNDSIRIEIEDNGKGIAAKDLGNIFERFYRTDASRNSARGGSGIGLSIVKKIIEDHGGYIWATSKEGVGTCMHFVIRKHSDNETESESIKYE
ncbi:MAG: HAMP domain-containing histidine kinase [Lachnospiraceae bacterium]|nr:HAMP domain-containing histidine kinase [Lachnospiraceae bacterium]